MGIVCRCVGCHHVADMGFPTDVPMCPRCFSPMVATSASLSRPRDCREETDADREREAAERACGGMSGESADRDTPPGESEQATDGDSGAVVAEAGEPSVLSCPLGYCESDWARTVVVVSRDSTGKPLRTIACFGDGDAVRAVKAAVHGRAAEVIERESEAVNGSGPESSRGHLIENEHITAAAEVSGGTPLSEPEANESADRRTQADESAATSGSLGGGTTETAKPSSPEPDLLAAAVARAEAARDEARDEDEEAAFTALGAMWPDYDFGGCYHLGELLSHAARRLSAERADTSESVGRLEAELAATKQELIELRALVASDDPAAALARERIHAHKQRERLEQSLGRLEEALRALAAAVAEERRWATGTAEHNDALTALYECARVAAALVGVEPPPGKDLGAARGGVVEPGQPSGDSVTGLEGPIHKALWLLGEGRLRGWSHAKIDEVVAAAVAELARGNAWLCPDCNRVHGRNEPCPI